MIEIGQASCIHEAVMQFVHVCNSLQLRWGKEFLWGVWPAL